MSMEHHRINPHKILPNILYIMWNVHLQSLKLYVKQFKR